MTFKHLDRWAEIFAGRVTQMVDVAPRLVATVGRVLTPEGVAHLVAGRLLIPRAILEKELRAALGPPIELLALDIRKDDLLLTLEHADWGGWIRVQLRMALRVEEVTIDDTGQRAVVRLGAVSVLGRNLAGRLASAWFSRRGRIVPAIERHLADTAVPVRPVPGPPGRFEIDLSGLPPVRRLREARFEDHSLLHWLKVVGCRYAPEGLLLQGRVELAAR